MFLLDTSLAILVRDDAPGAVARVAALGAPTKLSVVVRVELEGGVQRRPELARQRRARLDRLLQTFEVVPFDDACAEVHPESPEWTTVARDVTDLAVVATDTTRRLGTVTAHTGVVDVTNQVVAYQRRRLGTGEVLAEFPLDLPARQLRTRAVWLTLDERAIERAELDDRELPGSLHVVAVQIGRCRRD